MDKIDTGKLQEILDVTTPAPSPTEPGGSIGAHLATMDTWRSNVHTTIEHVLATLEDKALRHALCAEEQLVFQQLEKSIDHLRGSRDLQDTMGRCMNTSDARLSWNASDTLNLPTPPIALLKNPYFAQRMLHYLYDRLPKEQKNSAGMLLSMLLNNALLCTDAKQEDIHQIIDLSNLEPLSHLATNWPRGRLTILGHAGNSTGARMSGGELFVPETVGNFACAHMTGGRAHFGKTGPGLGYEMSMGTIFASTTGSDAGREMRGGRIYIGDAGPWLGRDMRNGMIVARTSNGSTRGSGGRMIVDDRDATFPGYECENNGVVCVRKGKYFWQR